MIELALHFNPPGSPREIGCSAGGGAWTTALPAVTCPACKRLYTAPATNAALDERRRRAREVFDAMLHDTAHDEGPIFELGDCADGAITEATRVRVTPEIMRAAERENVHGPVSGQAIVAAFRAAGFEVEQ
jgi:hypothetical protein